MPFNGTNVSKLISLNGTINCEEAPGSILLSNYLMAYLLVVIAIIVILILITARRSVNHPFYPNSFNSSSSILSKIKTNMPSNFACFDTANRNSPLHYLRNTTNAMETNRREKIREEIIIKLAAPLRQQEPGGCGLENFGNACYINSALQCLCHIRPFIDIIWNLPEQQLSQLSPITSAYRRLLLKMQSTDKGSTSAHEIKSCIGELNPRFSGNNEQDSHEFLILLIETLDDELMDNYQNSSIGDLIHGTIRSTVKCIDCGKETDTLDSFVSLPLPIHGLNLRNLAYNAIMCISTMLKGVLSGNEQTNYSLYDCIRNFLLPEQLGLNGQWFCDNCDGYTNATKNLNLYQLPKILILQLKRFTYDLTNDMKITTKIDVQETLNFQQFVKKNGINPSTIYNLMAVLAHTGTLTNGHCTTYARHLNNLTWYHFDDSFVRPVTLNEVLKSDIYVLVYEQSPF